MILQFDLSTFDFVFFVQCVKKLRTRTKTKDGPEWKTSIVECRPSFSSSPEKSPKKFYDGKRLNDWMSWITNKQWNENKNLRNEQNSIEIRWKLTKLSLGIALFTQHSRWRCGQMLNDELILDFSLFSERFEISRFYSAMFALVCVSV